MNWVGIVAALVPASGLIGLCFWLFRKWRQALQDADKYESDYNTAQKENILLKQQLSAALHPVSKPEQLDELRKHQGT